MSRKRTIRKITFEMVTTIDNVDPALVKGVVDPFLDKYNPEEVHIKVSQSVADCETEEPEELVEQEQFATRAVERLKGAVAHDNDRIDKELADLRHDIARDIRQEAEEKKGIAELVGQATKFGIRILPQVVQTASHGTNTIKNVQDIAEKSRESGLFG